ncbi:ubiquitin-conjugating enzyme E2 D1-like [Impatiens glandulifera]|uniref:ubiquitin-conjugating enzyme E2 D1-like n=1 Tax=Impatiens glandulifera TaxID=253017 RepID=UPI001FB0619E|nr:ubiquitin-conjugating enzyme E2 D1-like [Impatiens glandulifera]
MEHQPEDQSLQIRESLFKIDMFDGDDDQSLQFWQSLFKIDMFGDGQEEEKSESFARERLEMEMKDINDNPPTHISYGPVDSDDLFNWKGTVTGALDSPYEGGIFYLSLRFPLDYPFNPPTVKFITKVYHPCIDEKDGRIDHMDILYEKWSPVLTVKKLMLSIASFLSHPDVTNANANGNYIAQIYLDDTKTFRENARKWTFQYAMS